MAFFKQSMMALLAISLFVPLGGQEACDDGSDPIDPCVTQPDAPGCDLDITPPPPPPQPTPWADDETCAEHCDAVFDKAYRDCLYQGGEPEVCEERGDAAKTSCLEEECGVAPSPPPEPTPDPRPNSSPTPRPDPEPDTPVCESICEQEAEASREACAEAGGSYQQCAEEAEAAYIDCAEATCDMSCGDVCEATAEEVRYLCLEAGYDYTYCSTEAQSAYMDCQVHHCGAQDPCEGPEDCDEIPIDCEGDPSCEYGPEPTGESKCYFVAQQEWEGCLSYGTSQRDCDALYASSLDACLGDAAQSADCQQGCESSANDEASACYEETGGTGDCESVYNLAYDQCMGSCQIPQSCEVICGREAPIGCHDPFYCGQNVRSSVESGGDYESCMTSCFSFEIPADGGPISSGDGNPGGPGDEGEGAPPAEGDDEGGDETPTAPGGEGTPHPHP